jgi:hypothetical protein
MPSRRQRRRREKLQRHEWEFVQYDEEGNEIVVEPAPGGKEKEKAKPAQTKQSNGKPTSRSGRPLREVKPPSWNRAAKRALLFVPFLFIFLSLGKHAPSVPVRIAISTLYAAVFVPMFFFVDRLTYRAYKRRTGGT